MKRTKEIIRLAICTVAVVLTLSVSVLGCNQKEPDTPTNPTQESSIPTEGTETSATTDAPETTPPGETIPIVDRQAKLADAKENNTDTVAWLYIPGADVDDPVVQAEDNGYYLHLDENGNYAVWGCYYADCRNSFEGRDGLDTNTVIYGHSASNCDAESGPKFTKLHRYMDAAFVEENPYIYLSVDGEDLIFQITACFITDVSFDYIDPNPTGTDLTDFFETVGRKNWLDMEGVTFSEGDQILTLSTCCRKYDTNWTGNIRLVVMAKLLPENAAAQDISVSIVSDPEMP